MSVITDPKQMELHSTRAQIAEAVYEAATDGKDQLRYVAGPDARPLMQSVDLLWDVIRSGSIE